MKSLQLDKPHAIVVIGLQGSGKTFFAQKFADTFKAPFIEQAAFEYMEGAQKSARELMIHMINEFTKTSRSFIIELALPSRDERAELARMLHKSGYATMFVWVQVDIETAMTRTYRAHRIPEKAYREAMRLFSIPQPNEQALVVSGKHTFATQAKAVLRRLSSPRQTTAPTVHSSARTDRPQQRPPRGQIIVR